MEGVSLRLEHFELEPVGRYVDALRKTTGTVTGEVALRGPVRAPQMDGELLLAGGTLKFARLVGSVDGIEGRLELAGDRVRVERLQGRMGRGRLALSGAVRMEGLAPSVVEGLRLEGRDLLLVEDADLRLRGDLAVVLDGDLRHLVLGGQVDLREMRYYRDFGAAGGGGGGGGAPAGEEGPLSRMRLDLAIQGGRGLWIDNKEALVECRADLRLAGTAAAPELQGLVEVVEGRVTYFDNTFEVRRGRFSFGGLELDRPELDILARTRTGGHEVNVTVTGRPPEPAIGLHSTPPLAEADILSLLTIGYTREEAVSAGAGEVAGSRLATWLKGRLSEEIRSRERTITWLDRLELEGNLGVSGETGAQFRAILPVGDSDRWRLEAERDRYGYFNVDLVFRQKFR